MAWFVIVLWSLVKESLCLLSMKLLPILLTRVCVKHQLLHLFYCCCHNKQLGMQKAGSGYILFLTDCWLCWKIKWFLIVFGRVCLQWMMILMYFTCEGKTLYTAVFLLDCVCLAFCRDTGLTCFHSHPEEHKHMKHGSF